MSTATTLFASSSLDAPRSRQVVFEFPDYQSALACYHDPEYEGAYKLRVGAAEGDVVIVEGYDGPQPT